MFFASNRSSLYHISKKQAVAGNQSPWNIAPKVDTFQLEE